MCDLFSADKAKSILSIPLGRGLSTDRLIWYYEKTRTYFVKSSYRLAQTRIPDLSALSSLGKGLVKWWKEVWQLHISSKIKIFFWRLCLDRLPTGNNLLQRGVNVPNQCAFCGQKGEDLFHVFWNGKFSKNQRLFSKFNHLPFCRRTGSFLNFLRDCRNLLNWPNFEELVVFFWSVWNRRNAGFFSNGNGGSGDLVGFANSYISESRMLAHYKELIYQIITKHNPDYRDTKIRLQFHGSRLLKVFSK